MEILNVLPIFFYDLACEQVLAGLKGIQHTIPFHFKISPLCSERIDAWNDRIGLQAFDKDRIHECLGISGLCFYGHQWHHIGLYGVFLTSSLLEVLFFMR